MDNNKGRNIVKSWNTTETYPNLGLTENKLLVKNIESFFKQILEERIVNYIEFKVTPISKSGKKNQTYKTFKVSMFSILEDNEGSYIRTHEDVKNLLFNKKEIEGKNLNSFVTWIQEGSFDEIIISSNFLFLKEKDCKQPIPKNFKKPSELTPLQRKEAEKYILKRTEQFQKLTTELIKVERKEPRKVDKVNNKISPY